MGRSYHSGEYAAPEDPSSNKKGEDTRKAEELVGKRSIADKLAEERKRKKKRLDEIMGR